MIHTITSSLYCFRTLVDIVPVTLAVGDGAVLFVPLISSAIVRLSSLPALKNSIQITAKIIFKLSEFSEFIKCRFFGF